MSRAPECSHHRAAASRAARDFSNQQRTASIKRQQRENERQAPDAEIAEEKLSHDGREHRQENRRCDPPGECRRGHDWLYTPFAIQRFM